VKEYEPFIKMAEQVGEAMIGASDELKGRLAQMHNQEVANNVLINASILHLCDMIFDNVRYMKDGGISKKEEFEFKAELQSNLVPVIQSACGKVCGEGTTNIHFDRRKIVEREMEDENGG
jgi:hypothetical protein